jgi:hypothetical protein
MSMLVREGPRRVPVFVWVLLALDVGFALIYVASHLPGVPSVLAHAFDLDGESNVPTWYQSVLWFTNALAAFGLAEQRVERSRPRTWSLWALPLLFLAFSADEVVQIHERIGADSDVLLPGGTRVGTAVPETGLFFLILGLPALVGVIAILIAARPALRVPPGAFARIAAGFGLFLTGAIGVDFLGNFVPELSPAAITLITIEETLEPLGATVILWGVVMALLYGPLTKAGSTEAERT